MLYTENLEMLLMIAISPTVQHLTMRPSGSLITARNAQFDGSSGEL